MAYTVYPNAIDSSDQLPVAADNVTPVKAEVVNRQRDAILAIESELGVQPSGTYTTVRARLDALDTAIASLSARVTALENGSSGILSIQQNGIAVVNAANIINFSGSGVTVTNGGNNTANVSITGGGGGAGTLAQTLVLGNTTGGNNIILSSGDSIESVTGTITLGGLVRATGLIAVEQSSRPFNPTGTGTGLIWVSNATSPNRLIYSDETGVDHVLTGSINAPLTLVAVAGRENTNVVAPDDDGKGVMPFNPTEITGYADLTYTFQAVLETTSAGLPAEIYLYNITDGVVVPTFLSVPLTTISVVPVLLERTLTLSTDLPLSAKLYEVIIRFASGSPGPADRVTCRNAQIKVSN